MASNDTLERMPHLRVAVISGGTSSEHDVSLSSGKMVMAHLDAKRYAVESVRIGKDGRWRFSRLSRRLDVGESFQELRRRRFDVAFIALHGPFGEDGHMQALLESIRLPYTGSGVLASALAMDKEKTNVFARSAGLEVPSFLAFDARRWRVDRRGVLADVHEMGTFPVVVKPVCGGSSAGVFLARNETHFAAAVRNILHSGERVLIQAYVRGTEFTCGVIEDEHGCPFALPPTKILPRSAAFYTYQAKYKTGGSLHEVPANIPPGLAHGIQGFALRIHLALGCRGMSRSDFILKDGSFHFLETNTIPGMTQTSLLPEAAAAIGLPFPALLDRLVRSALHSYV